MMSDIKTANQADPRRVEVTLAASEDRPWLVVRLDVFPPGAEVCARTPDGSFLNIRGV